MYTAGEKIDSLLMRVREDLRDEETAVVLEDVRRLLADSERDGSPVHLSDVDLARLRELAGREGRAAVQSARILADQIWSRCEYGPVTWENVETWIIDPMHSIRVRVRHALGSTSSVVFGLCSDDKKRCALALADAAEAFTTETYLEHDAYGLLWSLTDHGDEWFDAVWEQIGRLVESDHPRAARELESFVAEALNHGTVRPDDERFRSWLESGSSSRKYALLRACVTYDVDATVAMGIACQLQGDPDPEVGASAELVALAADIIEQHRDPTPQESERFRSLTRSPNMALRVIAIKSILGFEMAGTEIDMVDWSEIDSWALDPDPDIRDETIMFLGLHNYEPGAMEWVVGLIAEAAGRYASFEAGNALLEFARRNEIWFDTTWRAVDRLLEQDKPDVESMLTSGYIEEVLRYWKPGTDDPRIKHWVENGNPKKKRILLETAGWLGLDEGRLREIVGVLTEDADPEIADRAKELLSM